MAMDETDSQIDSLLSSLMAMADSTTKKPRIPARMGHLLARKHRIERWAFRGRSSSIGDDTEAKASVTLKSSSAQKRSESLFSQSGRTLNIRLLQLSEQRQKVIDQRNFDQKLFANKQALKHKDNPAIHSTLNYVRKCCKFVDKAETEENSIDPAIFLEENQAARRSRSRSPSATPPSPVKRNRSNKVETQTSASLAETFLHHNRKHLESYRSTPVSRKTNTSRASTTSPTMTMPSETPPIDEETQKRHVQFRIGSAGQRVTKNNGDPPQKPISALGIRVTTASHRNRSTNSAPLIRTLSSSADRLNESPHPPRRSLTRIRSAKTSLEEFRQHPERFLSASNRYLPLLRRQAMEAENKASYINEQRIRSESIRRSRKHFTPSPSRMSDGSDMTYEDAKSFLSEETEFGKIIATSPNDRENKTGKRSRPSSKLNLMDTVVEDNSERLAAIARLRDREYAHLQELIQSSSIEQILEPLSTVKTDDYQRNQSDEDKKLNFKRQSSIKSTRPISPESTIHKLRPLAEILQSIDSLQSSDIQDQRARRKVDLEKNRAKLGILIF